MTIRNRKQTNKGLRALGVLGGIGALAGAGLAVSRRFRHKATGLAHQKLSSNGAGAEGYDDVTLARKVESEIFRDADAPKGDVVVNAEHGVVFLRGEVPPEQVEKLAAAARKVDGVRDVQNLLHPPGTPAPMKS